MRVLQRVGRVVRDVEHRLDQLLAVAPELGNGDVVVAHHPQAARELGQDQAAHALAHLVDVDVAQHLGAPVRRQQPVHQRLQPVGLVDDDLGVLHQLARLQLHLQQLRRPAYAAERVLDFVGQVADQLLVGLGLVDEALLALLAGLLLQRQQLHHHFTGQVALGQHHVHRQRFVVQPLEVGVVADHGVFVAHRPLQGVLQQLGGGEPVGQRHPRDAAARQAQGVFQRVVGKQHAPWALTTATKVASMSRA
jgi:hypothetical protein